MDSSTRNGNKNNKIGMRERIGAASAVMLVLSMVGTTTGFSVAQSTLFTNRCSRDVSKSLILMRLSSPKEDEDATEATEDRVSDQTTFDDAGRSLMDEQDMKRMQAMGDFDVNPNVRKKF
jgi:hypothetical protein